MKLCGGSGRVKMSGDNDFLLACFMVSTKFLDAMVRALLKMHFSIIVKRRL